MPTDPAVRSSPVVVALGGFDGVHLGHRQIIRRCRELAHQRQALTGVLTFDPLPAQLVYPDFTYVLTPLAEKTALLVELGVELIHAVRFTEAVRNTGPAEFVRDHVVGALHPLAVVVGHDHRFGAKGSGDVALLADLLAEHRVALEVVPEFLHLDAPVRSTRIREHLLLGHVALAAELLGRPYALSGAVVPGTATGRKLGFPTINIQPHEPEKLVPADGVYTVLLDLNRRRHPAVLNIGHRPTFGGDRRSIEAHIIDRHEPIQSGRAAVHFLDRLRPERRFAGPQELAAQIGADVERARKALRNLDIPPASDV